MRRRVLLDAGPLVAIVNRRDHFHNWAKKEWGEVESPLLTCEAVLAEACFLLRNVYGGKQAVISFIIRGIIKVPFDLGEEAAVVQELLVRYQSVPMSLADACLVRMSELYPESMVLTLDSDFLIYRKHKNQSISVIMPVE